MGRARVRALCVVAAATMGVIGLSSCDKVEPIGEVRNPSASINRDGAASALVGGKVFWAFGDTFTSGGGVRNSGAYATLDDPTDVSEPLTNGVPKQLVPFTGSESAANVGGQ